MVGEPDAPQWSGCFQVLWVMLESLGAPSSQAVIRKPLPLPRTPMQPSVMPLTHQRAARSPAVGFTLLELLVATTLLSLGLLAIAGSAGAIVRLEEGGERLSGGAAAAASRLELLRASRCTPAAGRSVHGRYSESWGTAPAAGNISEIVDTVWVAPWVGAKGGTASRRHVYRSAARC